MNYQDAALVNSSLNNLGDALLQDRMLKLRQSEAQADRDLRTRQLDATLSEADKRTQIERDRLGAQQQHYRTIEEQNAATGAARMSAQERRDKQAMLQSIIGLNAAGEIEDLAAVNTWLSEDEHFAPTGIQLKAPAVKPPPQAGQNALAQAYRQADEFRKLSETAGDEETAQRYLDYAGNLEAWAKRQANPPDKPEARSVTVEEPGPGDTKVRRSYTPSEWEQKQSGESAQGKGAADALAMPSDKTKLVAGKRYVTKRGVATWDGTKFVK